MRKNCLRLLMVVLAISGLCNSCKKWDKHNSLTDPNLGKDLFQQIREEPELSRFAELLTKSGYDKVIASSKNYTVFAPVNAALVSLDPAIEGDDARLRLFVGNHISGQLQQAAVNYPVRLQMINGKYNNLNGLILEVATITTANRYGKNGLLHIIDKMVPALPNAWEFVQTDPSMPAHQKNFLLAHNDSIGNNLFLADVYDLRDEKMQFTFFVVADTAWDAEVMKYTAFFVTGTADSTNNLASQAVTNDFAVDSVYQPASIPDTILSKFNTKIGIDKSAIAQTIKVSNGVVHIMRKLEVMPQHKFQPFIIQGEQYDFARLDRRNATYFRDKFNPETGKDFRDVLVFNHDVAQFYLGYRLRNVPSLTYKAYWVAVHDNINNNSGNFRQRLGIGEPNSALLPYITVSPGNFQEVYLGEFPVDSFRSLFNIYLTADNSTNDDANKITVDYIRLEPVF